MTENEIITAWKCCSNVITSSCKECPFHLTYNANCVIELMRVSLDLYNRQKAEKDSAWDSLKKRTEENIELQKLCDRQKAEIERLLQKLQQAQSEAYREFGERVKEKSHISLNKYGEMKPLICFEDIDTTLKELTESNE